MPRSKAEGMGRRGVKTRCRGSWRHQHGGLQIYDAADVGLCPRVTGIETIPLTITKCCEHIVRTYIRISFCTYVHARVITACVHACAGSSTCMYPITNVRTYVCQYIPAYKCAGVPEFVLLLSSKVPYARPQVASGWRQRQLGPPYVFQRQ